MSLEHCAHALRRVIPMTADAESLALFRQYQAMHNIVPELDVDSSNLMGDFFDECRGPGTTLRLSVIRSGHFEPVKSDNNQKEEVLICTLPTNHRCKGFVPSNRK